MLYIRFFLFLCSFLCCDLSCASGMTKSSADARSLFLPAYSHSHPLIMYKCTYTASRKTLSIDMESMYGRFTALVLLPDLLCFLRLRVNSSSPESASVGGLELADGCSSCSLQTASQHVIVAHTGIATCSMIRHSPCQHGHT